MFVKIEELFKGVGLWGGVVYKSNFHVKLSVYSFMLGDDYVDFRVFCQLMPNCASGKLFSAVLVSLLDNFWLKSVFHLLFFSHVLFIFCQWVFWQ